MAGFALSNLVGLIRQNLVLRAFGTTSVMDAFNATRLIPDILFALLAGGALASAFIPTFTGFLTEKDLRGAWHLASAIANLVVLVLTAVSILAEIFAPEIVRFLYILKPELELAQQTLTVSLLRIMLLTPVIFGISGLVMGILNSHQSFLLPALAPTMYWMGWIFGMIFLVPSIGIYGLAWGVVLGACLHLAVQLPGLAKLAGRRYFPTLGLHTPAVREVGRLMVPRLFGIAVVQLNFLLNTILATGMAVGSLTAINTAWMIVTMPQVAIAQAIAIAALPTFSAQVARGQFGEMRSSLAATLRSLILLSVPASLGLILLRGPIVALLFQYGKFDAHSTSLVAWALLWYAAGLVGHCLVEILSRAFYALHNTLTPVLVGICAMSLNLFFSLVFSAWFAGIGLPPHGGLALANSLATAMEALTLVFLIRRRLNGLEEKNILTACAQALLASLVMCLALWGWLNWTNGRSVLLSAGGGVIIGAGLYALCMLGLGVGEAKSLARSLSSRISH
jgi:putative peptidoglycan lipid II flippase